MKKLIVLFAAVSLSVTAGAQVTKPVKKAAHATENAAKKVGNETAGAAKKVGNEAPGMGTNDKAAKTESKIVDEEVTDKMGPGGQKAYKRTTKKGDEYYFVDSKGKKHNINKESLKDR